MTLPSSIFSFNTLKLPRTFPTGAAFAAVLLLGVELGVRGLLHSGKLEPDPSLHKTLTGRIEEIKGPHSPEIWILGNSTLDWGINAPLLSKELGQNVIKLAHGSATVNASAAMLEFYINQTGKTPKHVFLTITKDDLNKNGYRADQSKTYLEMAKTNKMPEADWPAIRLARENIRDGAVAEVEKIRLKKSAAKPAFPRFTGTLGKDSHVFEFNLLKKFDVGTEWFDDMKQVCAKHGIPAPIVILMPVTDVYVKFHDDNVAETDKKDHPTITYNAIYEKTLAALNADGLPYVDHWKQPRTDYVRFRDAYHLNPDGQDWLTKKLGEELPPLMAGATPATAPTTARAPE